MTLLKNHSYISTLKKQDKITSNNIKEQICNMNKNTIHLLERQVEDLENEKSGCLFIYISLTVILAFFSFTYFFIIKREVTSDILPCLIRGAFSGAGCLGMFFGLVIKNSKVSLLIKEKKQKIKNLKQENYMIGG